MDVERLTEQLYGVPQISAGDIPTMKAEQVEHGKRLTRLEWGMIAILVATGAQGIGAVLGGLR